MFEFNKSMCVSNINLVYQKKIPLYNLILHKDYRKKVKLQKQIFFLITKFLFSSQEKAEALPACNQRHDHNILLKVWNEEQCVVNSIVFIFLVAFSGSLFYTVCKKDWLDLFALWWSFISRTYLLLMCVVVFLTWFFFQGRKHLLRTSMLPPRSSP